MVHDTKIGVIVREDLETWQKLNVTAFLSAGITAANPESIGSQYEDGSGNTSFQSSQSRFSCMWPAANTCSGPAPEH